MADDIYCNIVGWPAVYQRLGLLLLLVIGSPLVSAHSQARSSGLLFILWVLLIPVLPVNSLLLKLTKLISVSFQDQQQQTNRYHQRDPILSSSGWQWKCNDTHRSSQCILTCNTIVFLPVTCFISPFSYIKSHYNLNRTIPNSKLFSVIGSYCYCGCFKSQRAASGYLVRTWYLQLQVSLVPFNLIFYCLLVL